MDTPVPAEIQGQVGPCQFDYDKVHLGKISHKKSLITIFGHKHFRQKFRQKFDIHIWYEIVNFESNCIKND